MLRVEPNIGDVVALYSKSSKSGGGYQKEKRGYTSNYNPNAVCDHCKLKKHYKIDCFQLVGYPSGYPRHGEQKNIKTRDNYGYK